MIKKILPPVLAVLVILSIFGFIIYKDQQSSKEQSKKTGSSQSSDTSESTPNESSDTSSNTSADTSENTTQKTMSPSNTGAKELKKPAMSIDSSKSYTAILHTEKGDITIALTAKETPITVNNFVYLARQKFYDNTVFHRVIKGFMIQGGDPTGTGAGGPGYQFNDEKFSGSYDRGTVAMANAGPNTNGSQFFIMHEKQALPPNYVIFGKVTDGMDAVDQIVEQPMQPGGEGSKPITPVKIKSVDISEE